MKVPVPWRAVHPLLDLALALLKGDIGGSGWTNPGAF